MPTCTRGVKALASAEEKHGVTLDKIDGVGPRRKSDLLKAFKSVKAIREASESQLQLVVPKNTAKAVYDFFHNEELKK